jgi:hypothetical protein
MWRKGYVYVAKDALELCTHPRSLLPETMQRAAAGQLTLADARGHVYRITAFAPVSPFGGAMRIAHALLRSAYAAPIFGAPKVPSLAELKTEISSAVRPVHGQPFLEGLAAAESAQEVLAFVAKSEKQGWFAPK